MTWLLKVVQNFFIKLGYYIRPYNVVSSADLRLIHALNHFRIDTVVDIGANVGQFGEKLIEGGFKGKMISFEPLSKCHAKLKEKASSYPKWEIYDRVAIGAENGETEINITSNTVSSSLLEIKEVHTRAEAASAYVGKEKIKVVRLDDIASSIGIENKYFVKIDVQGFEMEVLKGGKNTIAGATLVSIEMSLIPVYENGGILFKNIIELMEQNNFYLFGIQTAFVDKQTGQVYQVDGIFAKNNN